MRTGVAAGTRLGGAVAGACVVLAGLGAALDEAAAQEVRGWSSTSFQLVELRPLERRSFDPETLELGPDGRLLFDGIPVDCVPEVECVLFLPGEVEAATVGTQDVGFTAWDLGVKGLSVTGLLRGRSDLGSEFVWPRSDDAFDALLAYAELARDHFRVRLGRQRTVSGLGFSGYDGASVLVRPVEALRFEAYGGRSLARGVAEPRNDALRSVEDFVLDQEVILVGAVGRARVRGTEIALRYQREIWEDRSGLVSERASLDLRTDDFAPWRIRGSVDWDVGFDRVGKGEVELERFFPGIGMTAALAGRRYLPYFELSTVWGFFEPVGYHEALGRVSWANERSSASLSGGWRSYEDASAAVIFDPLEDDGWRAEAGASHRLTNAWTVEGNYRIEWGVGAFLSSGDARLRWSPSDRVEIGVFGSSFQQFEEFRVGDGRVYGGGVTGAVQLLTRLHLDGGAALYRHDRDGSPGDQLWNQARIWTSVRVEFGQDPARPGVRLRR